MKNRLTFYRKKPTFHRSFSHGIVFYAIILSQVDGITAKTGEE